MLFRSEFEQVDLGDGVIALIGEPVESSDMENNEEEMQGQEEDKGEKADDLATQFHKETEQAVSGGQGNPPSWVADETLWEKAKRASEAALGNVDYAFVVWFYLKEGGSKKGMDTKQTLLDDVPAMTQPVDGMTADKIEVNPAQIGRAHV